MANEFCAGLPRMSRTHSAMNLIRLLSIRADIVNLSRRLRAPIREAPLAHDLRRESSPLFVCRRHTKAEVDRREHS